MAWGLAQEQSSSVLSHQWLRMHYVFVVLAEGFCPAGVVSHYRSVSCRYHECFADGDKGQRSLQLVMEWADGGDLESVIQRHAKARTYMSEDQILGYFVQLISALSHVHAVRLCFGGGVSVCCSTNVSCNEQ